jgi:hypothetical protein
MQCDEPSDVSEDSHPHRFGRLERLIEGRFAAGDLPLIPVVYRQLNRESETQSIDRAGPLVFRFHGEVPGSSASRVASSRVSRENTAEGACCGAPCALAIQGFHKMKTRLALTIGFVTVLFLALGSAQTLSNVRANVPFAFTVGSRTLPAGVYEFIRTGDAGDVIRVTAEKKGPSAEVLIVTRLAADIHTTPNDAHVVFDKVGESYILSELWFLQGDGMLLHITKETHQHRTINVPK